jgi:DNA-binding SARP family transcriptional activator
VDQPDQLRAVVRARVRDAEARASAAGVGAGDGAADGGRSAAPALEIRLLGPVRAMWQGRPIPSGGTNADALLALLALRGGLRSREEVSTELWPEGGVGSLAWLRQAIWRLRRAIGEGADEVLLAGQEAIGLAPGLALSLDVREFEQALAAHPPRPHEAVALYRGDLAEASNLECFARDRERLADLFEDALGAMAQGALVRGDLDAARDAAIRLLGRDPLREDAHALLITIHGLRGERSQVARQYRRLRRLLADELGVVPLPETELAYQSALETATTRSRLRVADLFATAEAGAAAVPGRRRRRDARETTA